MKKIFLKIEGMDCASCAIKLEKSFGKKVGIREVSVNFATQNAMIKYDEDKINDNSINQVVVDAGYKIGMDMDQTNDEVKKQLERKLKIKVLLSILFTFPIFIRMFWHWQISGSFVGISNTNWLQNIVSFIVVFIFGWNFHVSTVRQLRNFSANMDTLISLGTLSAYFYSLFALFVGGQLYFESAATITSLILLGKFLELKTKNRASLAMQKLMELGVKQARVIKGKEQMMMDIDKVQVGYIILVKPSEKIPLDGLVIDGRSTIDESMLTGESLPVNKKKNDNIFAATINKDGVLQIKVTKTSKQTVLAQIIQTVEQTQSFKAPIQKLADKVAGIFVPVVIGLAFLTFLGW